MCRRYALEPNDKESLFYRYDFHPDTEIRADIRVSMSGLILYQSGKELRLATKHFGFAKDGKMIYNAKSETVDSKKMFASSFKERRCVIPASYFYEKDNRMNDHLFLSKSGELLYLAGIYFEDCFIILTCEATGDVKYYHPRMPFCIKKEDIRLYLDVQNGPFLFQMLKQPEISSPETSQQLSLF